MEHDSITDLVAMLRRRGTDLTDVEVKAAGGGLSKSLPETISAFSNDLGGTIILGLAERTGFGLADGFNAAKMRNDLASMCADSMSPPVRASIEIVDFEDGQVVVADVPALSPRLKPCFVKTKGEYAGSYTRGGDGNRRLTDYEIAQLHANRGQPRDDQDLVLEATVEDLDGGLVAALLRRVRERRPSFADVSDEQALRRLKVLAAGPEGRLVPTLTGLLAVGTYPQEFFPQLNVTFVVVPATRMDLIPSDGPRFLDNRSFEGPIPVIVQDALRAITRNMTVSSRIEGAGREDRYEYPVEAVREAVANAVMHRDYSSLARGAQVQIEMYQDRLVVRSPGGIFGPISTEDLGDEGATSSRNQYLARLLEDVELPGSQRPVCENRGSGIPSMIQALRRVGMTTPKFDSSLNRFQVAFPKHALLDTGTYQWIAGLGQTGLSDTQFMALALMRDERPVTNQSLRLLGLERLEATDPPPEGPGWRALRGEAGGGPNPPNFSPFQFLPRPPLPTPRWWGGVRRRGAWGFFGLVAVTAGRSSDDGVVGSAGVGPPAVSHPDLNPPPHAGGLGGGGQPTAGAGSDDAPDGETAEGTTNEGTSGGCTRGAHRSTPDWSRLARR